MGKVTNNPNKEVKYTMPVEVRTPAGLTKVVDKVEYAAQAHDHVCRQCGQPFVCTEYLCVIAGAEYFQQKKCGYCIMGLIGIDRYTIKSEGWKEIV